MSDVENALKMIKDNDVTYVDFRFTDPRGKWQHTAQHVSTINEDAFKPTASCSTGRRSPAGRPSTSPT